MAAVEDFRQAWFRRACPRQSTQNPPSSVFDTRHASTLREYQSITAARYTNPRARRIYVISLLQTWLGRSTAAPRSKSLKGWALCCGCGRLVSGPGAMPASP